MSVEAVKALQGIKKYLTTIEKEKVDISIVSRACDIALEHSVADQETAVGYVLTKKEPAPDNALCELLHPTLQQHQMCPVCLTTDDPSPKHHDG